LLLKSAVQNNLDSESYALSVILRIFSNDLIRAEGNKFFHNHEPYPPEIIKLVSILFNGKRDVGDPIVVLK
jgi:hypothetical protein